jgi:hypothetical protein
MSQINDPKLQSSNFMRFINKINTGEVDFVDNQVINFSTLRDKFTLKKKCFSPHTTNSHYKIFP